MFCGECGSPVPDGNRFCARCGTPVSKYQVAGAAPPVPPAPTAPPPAWQSAPPVSAPPSFAPPTYPAPGYSTPPQPFPPQQPFAAPLPAYAAAQPGAPGSAYPMPPAMHWALVLVLAMFTGGLFGFIWFCIQAGYVRRIDPTSKARMFIVLAVLGSLLQIGVALAGVAMGDMIVAPLLGMLIGLAAAALAIVAVFSMRASLVRHFNGPEPFGLRLSGVMTFFFSVLYFQYHLSRIAEWKRGSVPR